MAARAVLLDNLNNVLEPGIRALLNGETVAVLTDDQKYPFRKWPDPSITQVMADALHWAASGYAEGEGYDKPGNWAQSRVYLSINDCPGLYGQNPDICTVYWAGHNDVRAARNFAMHQRMLGDGKTIELAFEFDNRDSPSWLVNSNWHGPPAVYNKNNRLIAVGQPIQYSVRKMPEGWAHPSEWWPF